MRGGRCTAPSNSAWGEAAAAGGGLGASPSFAVLFWRSCSRLHARGYTVNRPPHPVWALNLHGFTSCMVSAARVLYVHFPNITYYYILWKTWRRSCGNTAHKPSEATARSRKTTKQEEARREDWQHGRDHHEARRPDGGIQAGEDRRGGGARFPGVRGHAGSRGGRGYRAARGGQAGERRHRGRAHG